MATHAGPAGERSGEQAQAVSAYLKATRARRGEHPYARLLGLKTTDTAGLHARVSEGLSFAALERLVRVVGMPATRVAEVLRIPARTLHRRKGEGRFSPEESDRLLRLSRLLGKALELFEGNVPATTAWLEAPAKGLGDARPMDLAQSEPGALEVEALIGRLEHGVFA